MKNILIILSVVCGIFTGCGDDEWGNDNSAMEHVYYYGLCNEEYPGGNEKEYEVNQGETVTVPTQFFSVYTRSYSPVVYYYTDGSASQLVCGMDYVVVDANGNELIPDADGAYQMVWPNAKGGIQNIYVKALNGRKGSLRVLTFDPEKEMDNMDVESTVIVRNDEYEVRAFTENYYVTVIIK